MLFVYFDFWAGFWRRVAEVTPERNAAVKWIVQFGEVEKALETVHPDTGLSSLIGPVKLRIEQQLAGLDHRGLSVIFRIDRHQGLVHALRGPRPMVALAQAALAK
jgi:hypothetical protein